MKIRDSFIVVFSFQKKKSSIMYTFISRLGSSENCFYCRNRIALNCTLCIKNIPNSFTMKNILLQLFLKNFQVFKLI